MAVEKKFKVVPYEIHMFCDCGGEFVEDSSMAAGIAKNFFGFPTIPQKYKHTCNKCGYVELFDTIYPKIIYEREN